MKKYEILAPCGSPETLKAALAAGCDSVYLGAKAYNARASAANFDRDELKTAVDSCHLLGVKVYITFNTLYKDEETEGLFELAKYLYELGADAFITADIGIFKAFKDYFKDIKINASTQMCVHSSDSAAALKALGADRIILARELSLSDIKAIYDVLGDSPDLEAFVHGALCVSYSGRCLFSSFIGGRSGNRGCCAQPCRMEYTLIKNNKPCCEGALLSPKDIMCAESLGDLVNAGVKAFKIEGRMKTPPYVYETVKTYKKYLLKALEEHKNSEIASEDKKNLLQVFSRGGSFSEGLLNTPKGKSLLSSSVKNSGREIGIVTGEAKKGCYIKFFESLIPGDGIEITAENSGCFVSKPIKPGEKVFFPIKGRKGDKAALSYDKTLNDNIEKELKTASPKREITAYFKARAGEPISLTLTVAEASVTVTGAEPCEALNRPLTKEEILSRLKKTGSTPFKIRKITADTDENIYLPVKDLNALRREACDALEKEITTVYRRTSPELPKKPVLKLNTEEPFLSVFVSTEDQLKALKDLPVKRIYSENQKLIKTALKYFPQNTEIYFALPYITREHTLKTLKDTIKTLDKTNITGYLTRNLTTLKTDKKIICDHTLGVFNSYTVETLLKLYDGVTLSTELSISELKPLCSENTEVIAYGRLPLMLTEHCPIGNFLGDNKGRRFCRLKGTQEKFALRDRTGAVLPLVPHCEECFCEIQSPVPLSASQAAGLNPSSFRLVFTDETCEETVEIIKSFYKTLITKEKVKNIPKGKALKAVK
ncbi:MAG: U32 family peptidase [Eubacterium sp.]|nr:U32 family peptidase [Eubacterium sp.]